MPCKYYYFNWREDAFAIADVFGAGGLNYPRLAYVPTLEENGNWNCRIFQGDGVEAINVNGDHSLVCFVHDTPYLHRWRQWAAEHGNRVFVVFVSEGENMQRAADDPDNIDTWTNELNATIVREYVNRLCQEDGL